MRQVKVLLDDREGKKGDRRLVLCELIEDRPTTLLIKLPDGNVITRKKSRDLPKEK